MNERHTIRSITKTLQNGTTYNNLGISISVNIISHQYNDSNLAELTQDIMNMLYAAKAATERVIFFIGDYQNEAGASQSTAEEHEIIRHRNMRRYLTNALTRGGARVTGGTHDIPWLLTTCQRKDNTLEANLRNDSQAVSKVIRFWHEALDLWARSLPDYNNMHHTRRVATVDYT